MVPRKPVINRAPDDFEGSPMPAASPIFYRRNFAFVRRAVETAQVSMALSLGLLLVACSRGEAQGGHGGGPPPAPVTVQAVSVADVPVVF